MIGPWGLRLSFMRIIFFFFFFFFFSHPTKKIFLKNPFSSISFLLSIINCILIHSNTATFLSFLSHLLLLSFWSQRKIVVQLFVLSMKFVFLFWIFCVKLCYLGEISMKSIELRNRFLFFVFLWCYRLLFYFIFFSGAWDKCGDTFFHQLFLSFLSFFLSFSHSLDWFCWVLGFCWEWFPQPPFLDKGFCSTFQKSLGQVLNQNEFLQIETLILLF